MPTDPATVPTLTEQEIAKAWDAGLVDSGCITGWSMPFDQRPYIERDQLRTFASRIAALAASRVDTAEVERRAARKAWDAAREFAVNAMVPYTQMDSAHSRFNDTRDRYLARVHPAPAPRECVKCEACGGEMNDDGPFSTHGVGDCIKHLASEVKRLAAEVGQ